MRNLKKFLALVMAMVMAFSLMLTVNAANPVKTFNDADQITEEFVEAADVLTGMKVFQGDGDGFYPGRTITRAETAALIYRIATGDVDDVRAGLYANYGNFTDVAESDWFAGYVGYCQNAGFIKGKTPETFDPYGQVTGYEALAMILRAVGYDKNHEFEGVTWQTNVSALGTRLGVLDDVKTSDYANTLHLASRRDVVASILFRAAAYVNTVTYSPSLGYETNKVSSGTADKWNGATLGWVNFGLTSNTGIIVGNQDTGESWTKLGIEFLNDAPTDRGSYEYVSGADWTNNSYNVTVSYNTNTGIDMFGHKYKVWYDGTSNQSIQDCSADYDGDGTADRTWKEKNEFKTVYATFDKATLAAHVYATDADIKSTDNANGAVGLRSAAKGAGFANTNETRWSVMYSRIDATADQTINLSHQDTPGLATTVHHITPTVSEVETYYLVSNNDDKTVDVAVNVYNELARIDKKDTTANTKTLTLGNTKGVTSQLGSAAAGGTLKESALAPNSEKNLGTIVLATNIIGTDNALSDAVHGTHKEFENYYKLEVPATEENQIVASSYVGGGNKWNSDDGDAISINLADGSTLLRSGVITGTSADGAAGSATSHMISKCVTELDNTNMVFNQTYTIYKDKVGRFIGVTTGTDYTFLYGTFGDYEVGGLGTGTIKYAVTGVNWEGEKVENHVLTSIRTGKGNTRELATAYNQVTDTADSSRSFPITKKDLGNTNGNNLGNQIVTGSNAGFAINPAGNLLNAQDSGKCVYSNDGKLLARVATTDWAITSADAANGFADVTSAKDGTLLATNNTTFIIVSGHGTSDLDVKVYHGLSEFLNGSSQVKIDNSTIADGNPNGLGYTYYMTTADRYNNMDTSRNNLVDRVIMTDKNITGRSTDSLYFSNSTVQTGTMLNGQYNQFVMYNDGDRGYYFIEGFDNDADSAGVLEATMPSADRFYTLTQTKTVNGQPVYAARIVAADGGGFAGDGIRTDGNFCWANADGADVGFTYLSTSDLSTARIGGTPTKGTNGIYNSVRGGSVIYRVDSAKVVDLTPASAPAHARFESVLDLNNAISSGWGIMDVAIVNNGLDVSVIYVLSVTNT